MTGFQVTVCPYGALGHESCGLCAGTGYVRAQWQPDKGRWLIRVPVQEVPWASGTVADMACRREGLQWSFEPCDGDYQPGCCRWPKQCRAFDAGYTTGKGPTELPIVWNDGFRWRSGPPDAKTTPRHLFDGIWLRWQDANPRKDLRDYWRYGPGSLLHVTPEEVDDDGECPNGCEYICYHDRD